MVLSNHIKEVDGRDVTQGRWQANISSAARVE